MEQKEAKPCEEGTAVAPCTEAPGTPVDGASAEQEAEAGRTSTAGPREDPAPVEKGLAGPQGHGNGLGEAKGGGSQEAGAAEGGDGQQESTATPEDTGDSKETKSAGQEKTPQTEATPESPGDGPSGEPTAEPRTAPGEQEKAKAITDPETSEGHTQAQKEEEEEGIKEEGEPDGPGEEQVQRVEEAAEGEDRARETPSSPEVWPESPTEEGFSLSPDGLSPDAAASGQTSPSASTARRNSCVRSQEEPLSIAPAPHSRILGASSPPSHSESLASDVPQSPTGPPPSREKKEKAPERRASAPSRPRGVRAQNRKAIVDKFGGAASGPTALFRNPGAAGAAVGSVRNMLLEWCRAMTRNYQHVDIQNFSSSWSSGLAFCALIHKFFPDAFDYSALDPAQRRHNFTLAFATAETLADCPQLLEVDDMVRLAVPDSKCVYTYIQELYRSLVQKGLVKTKKK